MANEDFLAGNYTFEGSTDGQIVNEGYLATRGGNVFFVAANIENSAVYAEDGSLVLAGERVRIRSPDCRKSNSSQHPKRSNWAHFSPTRAP